MTGVVAGVYLGCVGLLSHVLPVRARYDAERVVAQFSERLRDQVDLDVLAADLVGVVD